MSSELAIIVSAVFGLIAAVWVGYQFASDECDRLHCKIYQIGWQSLFLIAFLSAAIGGLVFLFTLMIIPSDIEPMR